MPSGPLLGTPLGTRAGPHASPCAGLCAGPRSGLHSGLGSRRDAGDRGAATILAGVLALALMAVTALALYVGTASVARHRVETAADLAALAGAGVVLDGRERACSAAGSVAELNGAVLTACDTSGADVQIIVEVTVRIGPLVRTASGRARAGPVAAQAP